MNLLLNIAQGLIWPTTSLAASSFAADARSEEVCPQFVESRAGSVSIWLLLSKTMVRLRQHSRRHARRYRKSTGVAHAAPLITWRHARRRSL